MSTIFWLGFGVMNSIVLIFDWILSLVWHIVDHANFFTKLRQSHYLWLKIPHNMFVSMNMLHWSITWTMWIMMLYFTFKLINLHTSILLIFSSCYSSLKVYIHVIYIPTQYVVCHESYIYNQYTCDEVPIVHISSKLLMWSLNTNLMETHHTKDIFFNVHLSSLVPHLNIIQIIKF